jgi:hypothetical protein
MRALDRTSSLIWLLVSVVVFVESLRLGIGTVQNPGMGFMTFGASGILGILSLGLLIRASLGKGEERSKPLFSGGLWMRVLFVLFALALYSRVMPVLGYLISTFLLMSFLFWVLERKKLWLVFCASFLSTLITYFVFSKWLNCQFPEGLFGL